MCLLAYPEPCQEPGRVSAQSEGLSAGTESWAAIISCLLSYILLLLP